VIVALLDFILVVSVCHKRARRSSTQDIPIQQVSAGELAENADGAVPGHRHRRSKHIRKCETAVPTRAMASNPFARVVSPLIHFRCFDMLFSVVQPRHSAQQDPHVDRLQYSPDADIGHGSFREANKHARYSGPTPFLRLDCLEAKLSLPGQPT